ncbi:hypothetical protein Y1Q_0015113 [Alligator mississippiensis]|uniref:Uncharacterized protein n=1 Tax=Alligator mississippiensis TaxID=8496 RepID=A0A151P968_ALLMI|nr:hypothetical protein Y1Q_0015113 [Alligator mississippiensis]
MMVHFPERGSLLFLIPFLRPSNGTPIRAEAPSQNLLRTNSRGHTLSQKARHDLPYSRKCYSLSQCCDHLEVGTQPVSVKQHFRKQQLHLPYYRSKHFRKKSRELYKGLCNWKCNRSESTQMENNTKDTELNKTNGYMESTTPVLK